MPLITLASRLYSLYIKIVEIWRKENEMKLFVKADNYSLKYTWVITIIADIALVVFGLQENTFKSSFAIACGLTMLVALLWFFGRKEGFIIENDQIYYKSIRKKPYEINQIAGLHIVKDQLLLVYLGCTPWSIDIKRKGEYRYKIIYLKDRNFESRDNGVVDFWFRHSKHILFITVYDKQVIEYFKSKGVEVTGAIQ